MTAAQEKYRFSINERIIKQRPTKRDIKETKILLRDFGVNIDNIPIFNTISQLLQWRKTLIDKVLSN